MKYIKKSDEPSFFVEDTKELRLLIKTENDKADIWDNKYKNKRELKDYILKYEQNYLCCYCEAKINLDNSHIEHIKPKFLDYDNLTFDYQNLAISCEGICYSNDNKPLTCGHKKANKYDENLFLNPLEVENIREYFIYTDNGQIGSSNLEENKAKYTLKLLRLNTFNNYLPEARQKALTAFKNALNKNHIKTKKPLKELAKIILNKENLAFISFLRFKYKNLL